MIGQLVPAQDAIYEELVPAQDAIYEEFMVLTRLLDPHIEHSNKVACEDF